MRGVDGGAVTFILQSEITIPSLKAKKMQRSLQFSQQFTTAISAQRTTKEVPTKQDSYSVSIQVFGSLQRAASSKHSVTTESLILQIMCYHLVERPC